MSESSKTSESQNPAQDVQGAFDATVNAKVSAFVSLGLVDKLTPDNLNAYARVFDKTGSTEVKVIDQRGLEALTATFTKENETFDSRTTQEQQERDAARFSSKVKAGVDNFKKGTNLVSEGAKKAATTVSEGVDKTAKKLVGYVEGKKQEKQEAAAAKMAANDQKAKDAAEAKEAAEAEAAAQSNAAAEAKATRDAEKAAEANAPAEAKKATKETRVIWTNKNMPQNGVRVEKNGAEQKPNIKLTKGDFITFKGFTEADGSVISSALIRRFEKNQMADKETEGPENMWFIPWNSAHNKWQGELFSKCLPNLLQRSLGQKERTIDWFTVEKSQIPSSAPPPPELLPPTPPLNSNKSEDLDPLEAEKVEQAAAAAQAERKRKQQQVNLSGQGLRASSSSSSSSPPSSQSSSSSSSPSPLSRIRLVLPKEERLQNTALPQPSFSPKSAADANDLTRILGDDDDAGSDITDTVIWYISKSRNDFKVFVEKEVPGTITLRFEILNLLGPLTKVIQDNDLRKTKEFSKTKSGAANGALDIFITVPYSVYRDFRNKILGRNKNWTLVLTYASSSVEKQISLPGTWTAEKPSVDSMSASAAAPTAASKNSRPLFSDDNDAYLGGGKRRRSIKKNRRSIRRTTIRRRQYKNKNKNNRRYKK